MPGYWHKDLTESDRGALKLCRSLLPHVTTSFRVEVSGTRGPNFPAPPAGQSDERKISHLVRLEKTGLCGENWRATFSAVRRKRLSDSVQAGLSGSIDRSARFTCAAPRVSFMYV